MKAQPATIEAEVVVRDKDGNIKYQGPLKFVQQQPSTEEKEREDGSNPQHSGS